jgi:hypothetical protein
MKLKPILYLLFAVLILQSCGKDGAMGPAGTKGDTGATGATGATGSVGATGNANVSSYIFLNQIMDTTTMHQFYSEYTCDKKLAIPDSVYSKAYNGGLIFTYYKSPLDQTNTWVNSGFFAVGYPNFGITFSNEKKGLILSMTTNDKTEFLNTRIDVEVILIPASSVTTITSSKVNTRDLTAVKKAYHLN